MRTIKISDRANVDLRELQIYLADYNQDSARRHIVRLANAIGLIGTEPFLWAYFFLTGAPYRAKLFFIGRTSFWIVYEVDENQHAVKILRVWNSRQDPDEFEF